MKLEIENKGQKIKQASLLIAISGLLSKILAAIYRIPYQNIVGDRGFYAYQQIYPILAIISTLSLTAFPNILSSLIHHSKKFSLKTLLSVEIAVCYSVAILLVIFKKPFAILLGSEQFSLSLIILAFLLLLTPFLSFYRGMAQANEDMVPTSVSQVLEQFIRISIIILAAVGYSIFHWTVYETANYAVSGNLIASLLTLIYLQKKSSYRFREHVMKGVFAFHELRDVSTSTLIFLFYSIYLLLFQFIDSLFVKSSLVASGLKPVVAEATKGIYDRGQPLIQFGLIFSTALFTSYLPQLTKKYQHDLEQYTQLSQSFFEFLFFTNLTLTFGLISILDKMNIILFKDNKEHQALMCYCFLIFLSSMVQFFHQQFFIEGKNRLSFYYLMCGLLLKILLTPMLIQSMGVLGASLSGLIAFTVVLVLYMKTSQTHFNYLLNLKFYFLLIGLVFSLSITLSFISTSHRFILFLSLIGLVSLFGSLFLYFCYKLSIFKKTLWQFIPFVK